jgi:hypothetical protein
MTDKLGDVSVVSTEADQGTQAFDPTGNVFGILLEPDPNEEDVAAGGTVAKQDTDYSITNPDPNATHDILVHEGYFDEVNPYGVSYAAGVALPNAKPTLNTEKKIICWDLECTGLDLYNSRIILGSFWNLKEPKTSMVTFYDEDERAMVQQMIEYLNAEAPDIMTGYNTPYDIRFLTSRAARYLLPMPGILNAKHHEEMDFFGKGVEQSGLKDMGAGTLEDVALFLFHEVKPYSIEACFEAYDRGDVYPFYIRNRWDVATEGDITKIELYLKEVSSAGQVDALFADTASPYRPITGKVNMHCPQCYQSVVYDPNSAANYCPICGLKLPEPDASMLVSSNEIVNLEASHEQHTKYGGKESGLAKAEKTLGIKDVDEYSDIEQGIEAFKTYTPPKKASTKKSTAKDT